jgi:hypothetical protein
MTETQRVVGVAEISVQNGRAYELEYKEPMYDFATLKATTLNNKL